MKKNGTVQNQSKPLIASKLNPITLDHFVPNGEISKPYLIDNMNIMQKPASQNLGQKTSQKMGRPFLHKQLK
jgi:hypothetical protein